MDMVMVMEIDGETEAWNIKVLGNGKADWKTVETNGVIRHDSIPFS